MRGSEDLQSHYALHNVDRLLYKQDVRVSLKKYKYEWRM
jgi:hypothetical protein